MTGRRTASLLWIFVIALAAAGPGAGGVPTSREAAEPWVARADREIAAVTEPVTNFYVVEALSKCQLAVWTYDASPSDARRKVAAAAIRARAALVTTRPWRDDGPLTAEHWEEIHLEAAAMLAEVDDLEGTAEFMTIADEPTTLPSDTLSQGESARIGITLDRAFCQLRLGTANENLHVPCSPYMAQFYIWRLEAEGHPEMADALAKGVRLPAEVRQAQEVRSKQMILEMTGHFPEAVDMAEREQDPWQRVHAIVSAGNSAARGWRGDLLLQVRQHVFDLIDHGTLPDFRTSAALELVLEMSANAGDRAGVDDAVKRLDQLPKDHWPNIEVATAAASVGETDLYSQRIKLARAEVEGMGEITAGDRRSKRAAWMDVAAAAARAGDKPCVDDAISAAETVLVEPDKFEQFAANMQRGAVVEAYVQAGRFADAEELLPQVQDYHGIEARQRLAHAYALAGRFEEARKAVANIEPGFRTRSLCFIAAQQVKQNKTDGLAGWIDKLPTAAERAVIDLAVAKAISGRPNRWFDRSMSDE